MCILLAVSYFLVSSFFLGKLVRRAILRREYDRDNDICIHRVRDCRSGIFKKRDIPAVLTLSQLVQWVLINTSLSISSIEYRNIFKQVYILAKREFFNSRLKVLFLFLSLIN